MRSLNRIYRFVQAGRCLFNICYDDKFEQSEVDRCLFRKFDDGKVGMVLFVHVDDILAHAQARIERFVVELGEKFKVKTPACLGVPTLSPSG